MADAAHSNTALPGHLWSLGHGMNDGTRLRRATQSDAEALRELTHAAYAKWVPLIGRKPKPMEAEYVSAVEQHIIDIIEFERQIVAMVEMIPERNFLLIENIAVRPEHQSRGIGTALLLHAEQVAVALGFHEVQLYTNAAFVENIAFYSRIGFEHLRREPIAAGGHVVFMRKRLAEL